MSNIHGLNDLRRDEPGPAYRGMGGMGGGAGMEPPDQEAQQTASLYSGLQGGGLAA